MARYLSLRTRAGLRRPAVNAMPAPMTMRATRVMNGNIFNSKGIHVGVVTGAAIFDLKGAKLYDLKGVNIYRISGELVGHLNDAQGAEKRLDRSTDRLFPVRGSARS